MTLHRGNSILCRSSQQLQCLPLGPLKGAVLAQKAPLFELTQRPSGALDLSRVFSTLILDCETQQNRIELVTRSICRRLFMVENMLDSIKFGLSLWVLTYIGSWFNAMTLLILGWIGLFSIPKVRLSFSI